MNTKFLRTDKPKAKFAQSNINLLYKGNSSEIQSKPTLRSARLQLVGKLQGTRRNPPPPPWVPSIKAEMGGQDTKVNLVPPGGSGWGTGSSNNITESESKSDSKTVSTSSILKNITEVPEQDSAGSKNVTYSESPVALVKPPQKPFYAPRSSKAAPTKSPNNDSSDSRPLTEKSSGPMLPFYNRPSTTPLSSSTLQDSEVPKSSADEKPLEAENVSNGVATPLTGWAALSTEETDFQERINFSDEDEKETSKQSLDKVCNRLPNHSWATISRQPQVPVPISYPRTAWDQPDCFDSGSPMQHTFNTSFCGLNDGVFGEPSSIPISHVNVLSNRDVLLTDQFQETSFSAPEAQLQAQREERTLAFKSAVNRAQMSRKKRIEFEVVGQEQNDQSVVPTQSSLADVNVFSQSILQSGTPVVTCPAAFSIHGPVSRSPQYHNVKPVVDALYSNELVTLMHTVAFGNGELPTHMKSQAHLANNLPPWSPGSYSANSQPSFMHPSYSLSDSSKLPSDQGFYFNANPFATNVFNQQANTKSGHVQGLQADHSTEKQLHSYASSMGESRMIDHLSFQTTGSHTLQQPPACPVLENRVESDLNKELITPLSRAVVINNHTVQISAHSDGLRTAFTPPTVEAFPPQNLQPQPIKQQPHITPLMEVNISGKWSEKDFDTFPSMSSNRNYMQLLKPVCGFAKNSNDEKVGGNRFMPLSSNGRHYRGPTPRDSKSRSTRRALDLEENRMDGQPTDVSATCSSLEGQQGYSSRQRDNMTWDIYSRQQRVRGSNRIPQSHRGAPPDYDECQQHSVDFERQSGSSYNRRDAWKSGSNGYKSSKQVDNVIEKAGSGRGKRNICPGGRRYVGNEDFSKPSDHDSNQRNTNEDVEIANITRQNNTDNVDSNVFSDSEQGTSTLQPPGAETQHHNMPRQLRRGSNSGRARRGGQHSGSQRQPQRRDRTDRANTRRQNNRRHPDDDNDDDHHDYKDGPSNSNGTTAAATTASTGGCSTSKGEGQTNTDSDCNTTSNNQQQNGSVDAVQSFGANIVASAGKPRSHAHSSGYSHCSKNPVVCRPTANITGEIVPLMSINAEAPTSYCDNLSFLDPLSPPTFKLPTSGLHPVGPTTEVRDIGSAATCTSNTSSENGFVEVCSQTNKRKQKKQKPPISPKNQFTTISTTNRDFLKSRGTTTDQKSSKVFENDEMSAKDNHHLSTFSVSLNQAPPKHSKSVGGEMTDSTPAQRVNAWLKPLQEAISKKAVDAVSSSKAVLPTTASSYAWSVVVGSRVNASTVTSGASEDKNVSQIAEADKNVIDSKPLQGVVSGPSSTAPSRNPQSLSTMPVMLDSSAVPQTRQSNLPQDKDLIHLSDSSRVSTATTSTAATSANVCKVRPQKQPTNVSLISSSIVPFTQASKSESFSFPMSTAYSAPGNTILVNTPQFRRSIGDLGDWLGKNSGAYTNNSSSMFFDGYRSKKIEAGSESPLGLTPAAAAAAAALYLQQQQQPFRQTLHPLQQQQPMLGFGLPDLNMRHQTNRMNSGCSQSAMPTDSYFTSPFFGAGSASQAGSQQRSLYPPTAPSQQRGFPWQHQQHHSQQGAAVMAAAVASAVAPQATALWSSNYTPPPLTPHNHPPYVGVIGADRPSSTSITPRLQSGNASAMLYGSGSLRGGNRAPPGVGGALFAQTALPPPSGLYASSPTHPTPPPPLPYDPTFAYANGGMSNSSNVFAHQSGAAETAALLAAPHHSRSAHSIGDPSHTPHPPVFINAPHSPFLAAPATISVHGLVGPPTAPLTTHGLHF